MFPKMRKSGRQISVLDGSYKYNIKEIVGVAEMFTDPVHRGLQGRLDALDHRSPLTVDFSTPTRQQLWHKFAQQVTQRVLFS